MAKRFVLADGTELDMADPASIRDYVTAQLAKNVDPSSAQLKRLEMLEERAAELEEQQSKSKPAKTESPTDLAAARERLRQARGLK